jgi:hypothetical protein
MSWRAGERVVDQHRRRVEVIALNAFGDPQVPCDLVGASPRVNRSAASSRSRPRCCCLAGVHRRRCAYCILLACTAGPKIRTGKPCHFNLRNVPKYTKLFIFHCVTAYA